MTEFEAVDVAIVGAGPAGLGAALALRRRGAARVLVLEREPEAGGAPRHCGHPPFGMHEFGRVLNGPDYARRLVDRAQTAGVEIRSEHSVVAIGAEGAVTIAGANGVAELRARRCILATGVRESSRHARLISGDRPLGVVTTGTLQAMVHLHHLAPFSRPVVIGTELVSLSALLTCRKAHIRPVAMIEPAPRPTARMPLFLYPRLLGINHYGIRTTTAITDFSGYLILVVAVLLTLTFLAWGATFDLSRLTLFVNNTGEAGGGFYPEPRTMLVAFLVGLLYPVYTITGFDASAHTSEETIDARRSVPRGIFHSIFWSLAFGLIMAVAFVLAIPDLAAAAKDGANSWFNLFNNLPAPKLLKDLLAIGIVLANYCCALAGLTSISRMVFAFARDGGLPASHILRRVSPVHRTPVPAIWTCAALSVAVTLYSPAFAALAVGCAMFLYVSYAFPIAAGIVAEGKSWTEFGPFRLGIWSKPVALIVLIGTLFVVYAGIQPPFDILINYAVGLLILLLVIWFGFERKRFQGPPIGDMIARRQAEIRAAERAVGEAAH